MLLLPQSYFLSAQLQQKHRAAKNKALTALCLDKKNLGEMNPATETQANSKIDYDQRPNTMARTMTLARQKALSSYIVIIPPYYLLL